MTTPTTTPRPTPLSVFRPTAPLPGPAVEALARLELAFAPAPVDRRAVIAQAMRLMEAGKAALPEAPSALVIYERLERGSDGAGRVGFVAFKTAQRIVTASKAVTA